MDCSGLPLMSLVRLATTRALFVCGSCIEAKAGDKLSDVTNEIKGILEQERASKTKLKQAEELQQADGSNVEIQEPPASLTSLASTSGTQTESGSLMTGAASGWDALTQTQQSGVESSGETSPATGDQTGSRKTRLRERGKRAEKKDAICKYYGRGICKYGQKGEGCHYSHPKKCIKFMRFAREESRGCRDKSCTYYHPSLCRLNETGRLCTREKCKFFHRKAAATKFSKQRTPKKPTQNQGQVPRPYREAARGALPSSSFPPVVERMDNPSARPENYHAGETENYSQKDFRLLQEQMTRMEKQLRYLLDVRDRHTETRGCLCR